MHVLCVPPLPSATRMATVSLTECGVVSAVAVCGTHATAYLSENKFYLGLLRLIFFYLNPLTAMLCIGHAVAMCIVHAPPMHAAVSIYTNYHLLW
jgi:hypothetical protein